MNDFEFFVGNIEDGMLAALDAPLKAIGVKGFATYSGELDSGNLKQALGEMSLQFPLAMVSYTDGVDTQDAKTAPVLNRSLHFRHDCSFAVICASADARGESARRRGRQVGAIKTGVYRMIAETQRTLGGLNLKALDENDDLILLTHAPLKPVAVEYIARMPNITAYAVIFETYFRWSTPDRTAAGIDVTELILGVDSLNDPVVPNDNLPGVEFQVGG